MADHITAAGTRAEDAPTARIKAPVFYGAAAGVLAIALWAILAPTSAGEGIGAMVGWTSQWFGWFYILLATVIIVFVVGLGLSRFGKVKLGPAHSTPEHSTFAWASMLFAAGIGTDLMFFAVAEPVSQYLAPPVGEGGTVEAAREATVWTLFHYGISGWAMYALMGLALAYFSYRMNLPLAVRSALHPIIGRRTDGPIGHAVDLAAILGSIFGVAASLGIGVVQLNFGLDVLFGIPEGRAAQIGLIALAVAIATISAVSGIDRGIKRLSQLNVWLAIGLAVFVLLAGDTPFLLNGIVLNLGDYVSTFPGLTLQTFAFDRPVEWLQGWTLFFWAWWIAWASFVGLFLARISRGRTIRQFVAGTMIIPFTYILMWVSIFGNSAIDAVRRGDAAFGELTMATPERGFYTLLMEYPAFPLVAGVATFIGLLFYVTSADSGALVMANLSSELTGTRDDAGSRVRIFWAVATGVLTAAMLVVDGVPALQNATIIMGLPFAFVMVLVMVGLHRALVGEAARGAAAEGVPGRWPLRRTSGQAEVRPWARVLRPSGTSDEADAGGTFLTEVARPALEEAAAELRACGVAAEIRAGAHDGSPGVDLVADAAGPRPFRHRVTSGPPQQDLTYVQLVDAAVDAYRRHREATPPAPQPAAHPAAAPEVTGRPTAPAEPVP